MPKKLIKNLQVGFGVSLLILLLSSSASYISIRDQINNRRQVIHTQLTMRSANQVLIDLQNAETGVRGFLLTSSYSFLDPYYRSIKLLPGSVEYARSLVQDNELQLRRIDSVQTLVDSNLHSWERLIDQKNAGTLIRIDQLVSGKQMMDECRRLIDRFIDVETKLLEQRSEKMRGSSSNTSVFIVAAALISIFITIYFYLQIRAEFKNREKLQQALRQKDKEISRRLTIVQDVSHKISIGDYSVRVNDEAEDDLGSISASLNAMAGALQKSFEEINNNEWKQAGLVALNEMTIGNKNEKDIAKDTLAHLVGYGDCLNGAFYLLDVGSLRLQSAFGQESYMKPQYEPGEGIVGQVFNDRSVRVLGNLSESDFLINTSAGPLKVQHLIWLPLLAKGQCFGVIELGAAHPFGETEMDFYQEATRIITLEILAAKARKQVQTLLEETQAQAEELQAQHSELENLNTELEAQTQKLQASEEELRVQQEELMQSNEELEERSRLLEEKNELIASRNLEVQKKAEELALSTRYKSEFLANMSHELRTPLNSILLLSRLMVENSDDNLNEDQIESARVIQSSGSSLLSLIDEILDLSKIEAGKMELELASVQMGTIKSDLNNMFAPLAKEKGLHFSINLDTNDCNADVITDKLRLEQVLRNLLSNAIKFTSRGSVTLSIRPNEQRTGFINFVVRDTGIGISEENQKIIFEAFQQADGSTRRKFGGTGLGLSISRELARLLGGEITVTSELGKGSEFIFTLPLDRNAAVTAAALPAVVTPPLEEVTPAVPHTSSLVVAEIPEDVEDDRTHLQPEDKIILIVEDDTNFARALLKYTRQRGYKGIIVVRGDLAAPAALQYQPAAILLDIQLPVKDGWEVMDEIKSNPKTRPIPVHIMSSLEVKKESLLKGAIDFINKPVALEQISEIFKKIEDALTGYPRKVLIVEENPKHATALSYFLSNFNIISEIKDNVDDSISALMSDKVNCVILDMGIPDKTGYETLEAIKQTNGLEGLPIIIFTGKNLSHAEELKIKQYADSIVIKTAHSFQRILDEVGLFLHLVEEHQPKAEKRRAHKPGSLNEVLKNKTVLVADDDVRNIFSLTKTLEQYQMTVVSTIDGKEALTQLEAHPETSIILMDMMMPEMDGYETIQRIRSQPQYAKLPIIAVTAKAMTGDRERCIRAGASDYISKPVDKDQLLSLLRVWLYEN